MIQVFFIFCALHGYRSPLINKIDPRCYEDEYVRAWVYFTDKGVTEENYLRVLHSFKDQMEYLCYERRLVRGGTIDYTDLPLMEEYIHEIEAQGGLLITESKWLNAASFWILRDNLNDIAKLNFVYKITKVASYEFPKEKEIVAQDTAVYGLSYRQLNMFNIDSLHQRGFFGSNVRVGILDTGLRRKNPVLDKLRVIAEHDFLEGDQIYIENIPMFEKSGIYCDLAFWKTSTRLNLFVAGDSVAFSAYPVRDIMYSYSTDGGTQWQPLRKITNHFNNWARELSICGSDTMFVFYQDRSGVQYFVHAESLLVPSMSLATGREPSAVQIDDTIYVTYQRRNYLYMKKGDIGGFLPEVVIDSSFSYIKQPKILRGDTMIGIFYHIYPEDSIYFVKSVIPADTFSSTFIGLGKDVEAISFSDTIYFIWKDASTDPLFRVALCKSSDFGQTITQPTYLSDELTSIGRITLAKTNQTIAVMWETEGRIYFRNSFDNGATFHGLDSLNAEFTYVPTLGIDGTNIIEFYCMRGDSNTDGYSPSDPDYYFPDHGTKMTGVIGGYLQGSYVGVAPAAEFLVAKTENPDTLYEFPIEEDLWVCGLEWFESKGVDIVNSSLGYSEGYTWPTDFDGKTSPASIAAQEAVKRGVIIVNAAGNYSVPRIGIPGDAEGVITVGGIDTLYNRWEFSGYFPNPPDHGVKKPEIMCLSAAPVVINPDSSSPYLYSYGTSSATAMISGICALLLEGHRHWNVDSVRTALFETASHAETPSDSLGYGWPDALAAFCYSPADTIPPGPVFLTPYPNPFIPDEHDTVYLPFKLDLSYSVEMRIYSISGRLIKKVKRDGMLLPGLYTSEIQTAPNAAFAWDGTDEDGKAVASGLYYSLLITHGGKNDIAKIAVIK